jgi:hypothetical protein
MEYITGVLDALDRDYWLWVSIFAVLYVFSLYIYFFPTPLAHFWEPFESSSQILTPPPRKTTASK